MKGRKKQSIQSAKATRRAFLCWTWKWTYLPSSLLAPKPPRKKSSSFTSKSSSSRGCQDPHLGNLRWWSRWCPPSKAAKGGEKAGPLVPPMRPWSNDTQPPKSGVPGKREISIEWSLATVREAHQKALAAAAALEGEIERLSHPLSWRQPEVRVRSKSKDHWMHGSTECKKRWHQVWFSDTHTTYQLARENMGSGKEELTPEDSDLGKPPELEPGATSFLTRSAERSEEEGPPPEPPVGELLEWVTWEARATDTPDLWRSC